MPALLRVFRLVLLAVIMDATLPWVGAFTVGHLAHAECETTSFGDACACCLAETEMAAVRTEHPIERPVVVGGVVADTAWLPEGYAVPLFRPPIAA